MQLKTHNSCYFLPAHVCMCTLHFDHAHLLPPYQSLHKPLSYVRAYLFCFVTHWGNPRATCVTVGLELSIGTWWALQWDHKPNMVAPPLPESISSQWFRGKEEALWPFPFLDCLLIKLFLCGPSTKTQYCCGFIMATVVLGVAFHSLLPSLLALLCREGNSLWCPFRSL